MSLVQIDDNGLEVLDREDALLLLATATIGRIALSSGALPTIVPVNFRLVDDQVLIRSTPGSKVDAATRGMVVAFEVDDFDPMSHTGWSVVVTGVAEVVADRDRERMERVPVAGWASADTGHLIAIPTELVSGRRLHIGSGHVGSGTKVPVRPGLKAVASPSAEEDHQR